MYCKKNRPYGKVTRLFFALIIPSFVLSGCVTSFVISEVNSQLKERVEIRGARIAIIDEVSGVLASQGQYSHKVPQRDSAGSDLMNKLATALQKHAGASIVSSGNADLYARLSYGVSGPLADASYWDAAKLENWDEFENIEDTAPKQAQHWRHDDNAHEGFTRRLSLTLSHSSGSNDTLLQSNIMSYGTCSDITYVADEMLEAALQVLLVNDTANKRSSVSRASDTRIIPIAESRERQNSELPGCK